MGGNSVTGAVRVAGLIAIAGLLASGCTSHSSNHNTTTSPTYAQPFDVCSLPENVLRQAGLDPATKHPESPANHSIACQWHSDDVGVVINANTSLTVQDLRNEPGNTDFSDVTIAGRSGQQFNDTPDPITKTCSLAFPISSGGVVVFLGDKPSLTHSSRPACELVQSVAAVVLPALPA